MWRSGFRELVSIGYRTLGSLVNSGAKMKIYQSARISSVEKGIYIYCTDPQLIHSLVEQLKKIMSNYKIEKQLNDLSGCVVR
jgi:hypothetical protein